MRGAGAVAKTFYHRLTTLQIHSPPLCERCSVGEHVEGFSEEAGGECAATRGEGRERSARVMMRALFGGGRCMDMLAGEQLPRHC